MKIYLTFYSVRYEGDVFLAAYSTKEKAKESIESCIAKLDYSERYLFNPEYLYWAFDDQSYYIQEEEVY